MKYLLDTDTVVYLLRGKLQLYNQIPELKYGQLAISVVTHSEILTGMYMSNNYDNERIKVEIFFKRLDVLDYDQRCSEIFAKVKAKLARKGEILEDLDMMIAATALEHDLILVTNNTKHFKRIPRLKFENWVK